jgi:uncharacterized membrane protein
MAVLLSLILGSVAARIVGWLCVDYADGWPATIAVGLALMFVMTGVAHFAPGMRRDMIAIVPPRLPLVVAVTGALELLGAISFALPADAGRGGCVPVVLMLAMFPANVHASRMPNPPKSMDSRLSVRSGEEVVYLAAAVVVAVCSG